MSLLLQGAAHFLKCDECGNHGWIVAADGEKSQNCVTKRQAFAWLQVMLEQERISEDERGIVLEQIDASTLPARDDVLEALSELESRVDLIEEILSEDGQASADDAEAPECGSSVTRPRLLN
jgi:hypothetical protein